MENIKARVKVPTAARKGELVEIKTLVGHPMESGLRKNSDGKLVPREIVNKFICTLNGKEVFRADWFTAVSASPYMSFFVRASESGSFDFAWYDDDGAVYKTSAPIVVS